MKSGVSVPVQFIAAFFCAGTVFVFQSATAEAASLTCVLAGAQAFGLNETCYSGCVDSEDACRARGAPHEEFKEIDGISNTSLEIIDKAKVQFAKQKFGWRNYFVSVLESGSDTVLMVEFWNPDHSTINGHEVLGVGRQTETRHDIFRVKLDKKTQRVIDSYLSPD